MNTGRSVPHATSPVAAPAWVIKRASRACANSPITGLPVAGRPCTREPAQFVRQQTTVGATGFGGGVFSCAHAPCVLSSEHMPSSSFRLFGQDPDRLCKGSPSRADSPLGGHGQSRTPSRFPLGPSHSGVSGGPATSPSFLLPVQNISPWNGLARPGEVFWTFGR